MTTGRINQVCVIKERRVFHPTLWSSRTRNKQSYTTGLRLDNSQPFNKLSLANGKIHEGPRLPLVYKELELELSSQNQGYNSLLLL